MTKNKTICCGLLSQNVCFDRQSLCGNACDILFTISDSLQFDWSDADLDVQGDSLLTPAGNEGMTHPEQIPSTRSSPQPSRKRTHSQTLTDHKPWCVVLRQFIVQSKRRGISKECVCVR